VHFPGTIKFHTKSVGGGLHLSLASLRDGDAPAGDDGMVVVEPVDPVDVAALKKALTPAKTMMSFFHKVSPGSAPAPASSAGSKRPANQVATPSTGSAKKVTVVSHPISCKPSCLTSSLLTWLYSRPAPQVRESPFTKAKDVKAASASRGSGAQGGAEAKNLFTMAFVAKPKVDAGGVTAIDSECGARGGPECVDLTDD